MNRWARALVFLMGVTVLACSWSAWGTAETDSEPLRDTMAVFMQPFADLSDSVEGVLEKHDLIPSRFSWYTSGWIGSVDVGFNFPNVLAVLAGVLMTLLSLVPSRRGRWPALIALQLSMYGTLHMGRLTFGVGSLQVGQVRPAGWTTLAAFVFATGVLLNGLRARKRLQGAGEPATRRRRAWWGRSGRGGRVTVGSSRLVPARVPERVLAFLIDNFVVGLWAMALALLASLAPDGFMQGLMSHPVRAQLIGFSCLTLPVVLGFSWMEWSDAATPGKRLMGLAVVDLDGYLLPFGRAVARNAIKFLPWELAHTALWRIEGWPLHVEQVPASASAILGVMWGLVLAYLLSIVFGERHRALHDRWVGAAVVSLRAPHRARE